jgi:ABC-type Co2+ transport system permease subunit
MHISEGVLSPAVLASDAGLAAVGTVIGLKIIDYEAIRRLFLKKVCPEMLEGIYA